MSRAAVLGIGIGCFAVAGLWGEADARPAGSALVHAPQQVDEVFADLTALAGTLRADQREALAGVNGASLDEVWAQLDGILTPAQLRRLDRSAGVLLGDEEFSPTDDGGWYLPYACFSVSKVGLLLSVVGFIGCPGDVARDASELAWGASIFSGGCLLEGDAACPLARNASFQSAQLWDTLMASCSVADSAWLSEQVTYRTCGGPRDGEPTPTPEPSPTPASATMTDL